jgi:antitoxin component YwqK of YwqJK toxin-antitoxin module
LSEIELGFIAEDRIMPVIAKNAPIPRVVPYETFYPNGITKEKGQSVDGRRDGLCEEFFKNGKPEMRGEYCVGKKQGQVTYFFNNEQPRSVAHYDDDILNGPYAEYFKNGQIKTQGFYKNNRKHKVWKDYSINTKGNTSRLKCETHYKNGQRHGEQLDFFQNGKAQSLCLYNDDKLDGLLTCFYSKGSVKSHDFYKNGVPDGLHTEYYKKTGIKKEEGAFCAGKAHGHWHHYDPSGTLVTVAYFDNGHEITAENMRVLAEQWIENQKILTARDRPDAGKPNNLPNLKP